MRIPKTFVPDNNLENKVEDLLKPNNPVKGVEEQEDYKKRKIIIQSNNATDLLDNEIYVLVKHPKGKKYYSLYAKSLYKFFTPISGANHVPHLTGRNKIKTYVRNQGTLFGYINSLKFLNNGELVWKGDNYILNLKKGYGAWQSFVKYVMSDDGNS